MMPVSTTVTPPTMATSGMTSPGISARVVIGSRLCECSSEGGGTGRRWPGGGMGPGRHAGACRLARVEALGSGVLGFHEPLALLGGHRALGDVGGDLAAGFLALGGLDHTADCGRRDP